MTHTIILKTYVNMMESGDAMGPQSNDKQLVYMPYEEIESNILSQFDLSIKNMECIKFKNTDKQRAVYKIITENGPKCLKKVFYDKPTLLFIYSVTEWLNVNGVNCPQYTTTKKGHKYVTYGKSLFILTDWIEGRKCNYDCYEDIMSMSINLSKIHETTMHFHPIHGSSAKYPDSSYFRNYCTHFYHLLDYWNRALLFCDPFSKKYMELFEYQYEMAKESCAILNNIDFSKPLGDSISNHAICHLDYVNKNIVFDKDNQIYTIDFDNARYDYPVHDICYFLRRILKRDETAWDFKLSLDIMKSYEMNRPLELNEYKIILAMLMFPQKYWKLSKDYFKNRRYCSLTPYLSSLEQLQQKQSAHESYIRQLKEYIQNRFK